MRHTLDCRNPVIILREKIGINRKELLQLAGCTYRDLWMAEQGSIARIPLKLLEAFEKVGANPDKLARSYQQYRETLGAEIIARHTRQETA